MKSWQIYSSIIIIAITAGVGGYLFQQQTDEPAPAAAGRYVDNPYVPKTVDLVGKPASAFSLMDIDGQQRSLSEWQGKVVAINFWATWCPPCRDEIPHFVELQDYYGQQGLQFVGVALHTADEIRDFVVEYKVNYPSLVGEGDVIELGKQLGNDIGALPYTVIIDRDGIIQFTRRGPLSKKEAEAFIRSLL